MRKKADLHRVDTAPLAAITNLNCADRNRAITWHCVGADASFVYMSGWAAIRLMVDRRKRIVQETPACLAEALNIAGWRKQGDGVYMAYRGYYVNVFEDTKAVIQKTYMEG